MLEWRLMYRSLNALLSLHRHHPGSAVTSIQVAFIKQEALEKAREIKVKADEEFAIEKVRW
jgi:hypothetical protein